MKIVKENTKKAVINTAETLIGTIGTNILLNKAPANIKKFAPAGAIALGFLAQLTDNQHLQHIGAGMATGGAINLIAEHVVPKSPQMAMVLPPVPQTGISGLGYMEEEFPQEFLPDAYDSEDLEGFDDDVEFEDFDPNEHDEFGNELNGLDAQGGFDNL